MSKLCPEKFASINTLRLENKKILIRAAYRTLLFREVEDSSLNHLVEILHDKITFKSLIEELKNSEEFKVRHLNIGSLRYTADGRTKPTKMTVKAKNFSNSLKKSLVDRGKI